MADRDHGEPRGDGLCRRVEPHLAGDERGAAGRDQVAEHLPTTAADDADGAGRPLAIAGNLAAGGSEGGGEPRGELTDAGLPTSVAHAAGARCGQLGMRQDRPHA